MLTNGTLIILYLPAGNASHVRGPHEGRAGERYGETSLPSYYGTSLWRIVPTSDFKTAEAEGLSTAATEEQKQGQAPDEAGVTDTGQSTR